MKKINIFKIGGHVINDPQKLADFLDGFAKVEGNKILVHGGGTVATDLAAKMGIEAQMLEGRRITDDQMLGIVTMVYGGLINKQIVSALQGMNTNAIGLTGADGNLLKSNKRPIKNGLDYGWVGDPAEVNTAFLEQLFESNLVPVVAPLTHDKQGHILNTNADTIATTLAQALHEKFEVHLNYAFELDGVLEDVENPSSLIKQIDPDNYKSLKSEGKIFDGMIPKLDNAFAAISNGVRSVRIVKYDKIGSLQDTNFSNYTTICS